MYKVVIGLEVHCELETKSKNFSPAPNMFTESHNINVGTVDLGLPGILPVANKEAARRALREELIFIREFYDMTNVEKMDTRKSKPKQLTKRNK